MAMEISARLPKSVDFEKFDIRPEGDKQRLRVPLGCKAQCFKQRLNYTCGMLRLCLKPATPEIGLFTTPSIITL
jgi:hypothetical protein